MSVCGGTASKGILSAPYSDRTSSCRTSEILHRIFAEFHSPLNRMCLQQGKVKNKSGGTARGILFLCCFGFFFFCGREVFNSLSTFTTTMVYLTVAFLPRGFFLLRFQRLHYRCVLRVPIAVLTLYSFFFFYFFFLVLFTMIIWDYVL